LAGRRDERFDSTLAIRLGNGDGVLRNVSASGMYFVTDMQLQQEQAVTFTLEFADYPGGPLQVSGTARVVRIEPREGRSGVGAEISNFKFSRIGGSKHGSG
jgi:hypothetical protein